MATTCAKAMHDFTPAKTYALADTTTIEPWKVTYEQEYARRMYYGTNFNFSKEKNPNATAYWDTATQTFNDGSKEVNLPFAIAMIKAYDAEMSETNLDAIKEIDHFIEWLNAQDAAQNFPNLGENITVFGLDVLDSSPSVSVDNEQNLAKYQFNCTINYLEHNII